MRTYEEIRKYNPDFVVRYRLYSPSEGGRKITFQHLRCDFMYEGDDPSKDGIYMIHPQFLDEEGNALPQDQAVPLEGKTSMWILVPEMRASIHKARATVGTKGYFMEGSRKVGEVTIDEIVGLYENPVA
ncbi:hypothetical protein [Uliginosibacterium sp. 31-12]|uniref:hypothetical protein n=1 Tax=Uliginosibacterium sp. 31-12 TaxID=3062781 RepID=UPI0026E47EFE|nr:hypothetical protein [Uliginosibacterium sp. 31-12]MDO6387501.1 hypothetical protein [Uliginosibacterium sp. 31-12]